MNVRDLAALAANYRKTVTGGWAAGDFNYDGVVNVLDLALLAGNYRQTLGGPSLGDAEAMLGLPQSVPEPSALILLAIGGMSVAAWHRGPIRKGV